MKLLIFADSFHGGAGNVCQVLSKELAEKGYEVTLAFINGDLSVQRYDLQKVKVVSLHAKGGLLKEYPLLVPRIRRLIYKVTPDIVISFLYGVSSVVSLAMCGINVPLVTSERSNPVAVKPPYIMRFLATAARKRAKRIVVLFDTFKNFDNGKYFDKCRTIPNPVLAPPYVKSDVRGGPLHITTIGNFRYVKGFDLLIEAFAAFSVDYPDAMLDIYGTVEENKLADLIDRYALTDKVQLKGYAKDIYAALSEADIYVMPSRQEGFPNSLCEAMTFGLPCVAFLCHEGIREIIDNGINGITVEAENTELLAEAMRLLVLNKEFAERLGKNAKKISQKYSVDRVVSMWEDLLAECLFDKI